MDCLLYPSATLETLNLSSNGLTSLDVSRTPNLRRLYLDKNAIKAIQGLTSLKKLETLSWREQTLTTTVGSAVLPDIQYQDCQNIHHLHLSNNSLTSFFIPFPSSTPFLNLRTLELASAGLQTLSPRFGYMFPNLRILNLNYNAIRDLRPLVGIVKLQRLLMAGNRINRLRQTAAGVGRISGGGCDLVEVDLRQNPLTVGFYTPQVLQQEEKSRPDKQIALHTPAAAPAASSRLLQHEEEEEDPRAYEYDYDDDTANRSSTIPPSSSSSASSSYVLPPLDSTADAASCARLDKDTQLRRRVYEMMLVESCPGLQRLDGLVVEGRRQITEGNEDGVKVRQRLSELGVLR